MSMMRLLSAGRSLVDTKTLTPNYRMRGKFHLPKFGGPKNPFVQPVKKKAEQPIAQSKESPTNAVVTFAPAAALKTAADLQSADTGRGIAVGSADDLSTVPLKKTQRLPVPAEQLKETKRIPFVASRSLGAPVSSGQQAADEKHAGETLEAPGMWRKVWGVVGGSFKKMNAFAWAMDHKPKQKSPIPRFDKPAQGELSLDNIRVVRNDLCDSDLEIAPAKTFTAQTNFRPALQPLPESKKAEPAKAEEQPLFSHTCST